MTIIWGEDGASTIRIGKMCSMADKERDYGTIHLDKQGLLFALILAKDQVPWGNSWRLPCVWEVWVVSSYLLDGKPWCLSQKSLPPVWIPQLCLPVVFGLILVLPGIRAWGRDLCATSLLGSAVPGNRRKGKLKWGKEGKPIQRYIIKPATTWC